ncbi:cell wall-binding protein, partial [Streptococcus pneumoniae]|nr:cell wall-binding protein [Streptococcus pneumoniae]
MKASAWVYDKGEWYYVSSSGSMIANDWVKD